MLPRKSPRLLQVIAHVAACILIATTSCANAATVTVQVVVDRDDVEFRFDVDMGGNVVSLAPGDIATDSDASDERYVLVLTPRTGFDLTAANCSNRNDGSLPVSRIDLGTGSIIVDPGMDSVVDCVFEIRAALATVVATVRTDLPDIEQEFSLDMGGNVVTMWPDDIATDDEARADFYAMTLVPVSGYRLTDIACTRQADGARIPANLSLDSGGITLAPGSGETVDCVFSIQVQRTTVVATVSVDSPEPAEQSFEVDLGGNVVTLWPGDIVTDDEATPDFYAMAMAPQSGFQLMDIACIRRSDGSRLPANADLGAGTITFAPGMGSPVDCEFALRAAVATVVATVSTDSSVPVETEFTLEMNGEPVEMLPGEYATDSSARADLYRIALIPERRFRLEDVVCIREADQQRLAAEINFENQSVAFAPGIGSRVDCTFQLNALQAGVTVQVVTNRAVVEDTFELEMNGERVALQQGQVATDGDGRPDIYRIALLPVREFRLMDIACLRDGERLPANTDFSNQSIAFAPGVDSNIDCTFELQALKAQVTARVTLDAGLPQRRLTFDMNGDEVEVMSGETVTDDDANALLYRVALIPQPGMQVTDIACIKAGEQLTAITDLNNQSVGFSPGASGNVDCTFTVAGGSVSIDPFDLLRASGITPDASNSGLTTGPDGRPRIVLGVPGAGAGAEADNAASQAPTVPAPTDGAACCSCADLGASFVAASSKTGVTQLPCDFNIPAHWEVRAGSDGLLLSAIAGPRCDGACTSGAPTMSLSIAESPNNNALVQESIWEQIMPKVGSGSCGAGTVTFYQPPGGVPGEAIGAVRFHVNFGGEFYAGNASFSCGGPPDWGNLQDLFIDSFRSNPASAFPDR